MRVNLSRLHLGLPVLGKELVEQANRRRTYLTRVAYAALLFVVCGVAIHSRWPSADRPLELLGFGRDILEFVVWFQVWAIYLLLPVTLCGSITSERERNTLGLLLLTGMGPWAIVLQKLLSRLTPVFTFTLLTLPLLAVAYALGGATVKQAGVYTYVLCVTGLQVGAVAIFASAYCRTTPGAFILTAVVLLALYFGLFLLAFFPQLELLGRNPAVGCMLLPIFPLMDEAYVTTRPWLETLLQTGGVWVTILLFLLLARWSLTARLAPRRRGWVKAAFVALDRAVTGVNRRMGGVEFLRGRGDLPDEHPIAWMEGTRRSIAKPRYLVRLLLLIELPVLLACAGVFIAITADQGYGRVAEWYSWMIWIAWPIVGLWLTLEGARLFAAERSRGTLEVLLATPWPTREILVEKVAVLRRLTFVLLVPLLTLHLFRTWVQEEAYGDRAPLWIYVTCATMTLLIYPPWVVWLSCWVGMRIQRPARAALAACVLLVVWCAGPIVMLFMAVDLLGVTVFSSAFGFLIAGIFASPAGIVILNESGELNGYRSMGYLLTAGHFVLHASMAWGARLWCLRRADRMLGRVPPVRAGRQRKGQTG